MDYLCDSDLLIDFLAGRDLAMRWLTPLFEEGLALSMVSVGEIYEGILYGRDSATNERRLVELLGFVSLVTLDLETARRFGDIRGRLRSEGMLIGDNDLLIAATALRYDLTLVTRNRRHFDRIPDLRLHDPATP